MLGKWLILGWWSKDPNVKLNAFLGCFLYFSVDNLVKTECMISSEEVIKLLERLSIPEQWVVVEGILKNIREEKSVDESTSSVTENNKPILSDLAHTISDQEAKIWYGAIEESRKIL